jgi:cytochrome c
MRRFVLALSLLSLAACGQNAEAPQRPAPTAPTSPAVDAAAMQARMSELPAPYNEASYEAGRRVFAQCRSCHTLTQDGGHRVGPNLYGVFGREIGTADGFAYSQPVQEADFLWDAAQLDHWLENPRTFLPGNRMAFAGVRDPQQRRDLIAYLMLETAPAE